MTTANRREGWVCGKSDDCATIVHNELNAQKGHIDLSWPASPVAAVAADRQWQCQSLWQQQCQWGRTFNRGRVEGTVSASAADNAFWQLFAFADMSPGTIAIVLGANQAVPRSHRAERERQLTTHANCLVWSNFCVASPVWRQSARIGLQLTPVLLRIERAGNFVLSASG